MNTFTIIKWSTLAMALVFAALAQEPDVWTVLFIVLLSVCVYVQGMIRVINHVNSKGRS